MIKEFQALGLNISVVNNEDETVSITDLEKDDEEEEIPLSEEIVKPELFGDVSEDDYSDESDFGEEDDLDLPDEYGDGLEDFSVDDEMGGDF